MHRLFRNKWTWVLFWLLILEGLIYSEEMRGGDKEGDAEFWLKEAEVDLNADGQPEKISFRINEDRGEFLLTVNGYTKKGKFEFPEYPPEGFRIIDLDTGDPYKEILVKCLGSSDHHQYYFFAFDGQKLKTMGCLYRCVSFQGDGVIQTHGWHVFWAIHDKYVVDNKTRTLKKVPQEFYYVGVTGQVVKPFPLYATRSGKQILTTVKEGAKVEILAAVPAKYPNTWYLVANEDKLLGWIREKELLECVGGLPLAG